MTFRCNRPALNRAAARKPGQTLDSFLNETVQKILPSWQDSEWKKVVEHFNRALGYCYRIFGKHRFRKYTGGAYRKPINRGMFEAQMIAVSTLTSEQVTFLEKEQKTILKLISAELNKQDDFYKSLLYATGSGEASNTRIRTILEIFGKALNA